LAGRWPPGRSGLDRAVAGREGQNARHRKLLKTETKTVRALTLRFANVADFANFANFAILVFFSRT
jgi:hypothetical protein